MGRACLTLGALTLIALGCGSGTEGTTAGQGGNDAAAGGSTGSAGNGQGGEAMQGGGGNGQGGDGGNGQGGNAQGGSSQGGTGGTAGSGGSGGSGGASGGNVGDNCTYGLAECNQGLFCNAPGCNSGTCQVPLPVPSQIKDYVPVCGCDGVNYYNSTISASFGIPTDHAGVCTTLEEVSCTKMGSPCTAGLFCSAEVANAGACPQSPSDVVQGVCWGVPVACDTNGPKGRGCGAGAQCADTCSLIQSQNGWHADATCP